MGDMTLAERILTCAMIVFAFIWIALMINLDEALLDVYKRVYNQLIERLKIWKIS